MKREYEEPFAEIELFNIASHITTSTDRFGWEEEDESLYSLNKSKEISWE